MGGAGCNALNLMIDQGVYSAEFIALDSDKQALDHCKARTRFPIGAPDCAGDGEADRAYIKNLLEGANLVFIVAGMGGKTGTDAAAMVAEISRELNILTVAIVSRPYISQGNRVTYAVKGIRALREHVDTLIVVPIPDLLNLSGETMAQAFTTANGLFRDVVANIAEAVNFPRIDCCGFCRCVYRTGRTRW